MHKATDNFYPGSRSNFLTFLDFNAQTAPGDLDAKDQPRGDVAEKHQRSRQYSCSRLCFGDE